MKKILLTLVTCLLVVSLSGCRPQPVNQHVGMWVSFLEYEELDDQKDLQPQFDAYLETAKNWGVDRIYLHTTSFTNAYYPSQIFDQEKRFHQQDVFTSFLKKAHRENIEVYAWINPFRSYTKKQVDEGLDPKQKGSQIISTWIKQNQEHVRLVKDRYYLNPGYDEVIDLILKLQEEIYETYDFDGVIFDDYFYPEGLDQRFDSYAFKHQDIPTIEEFRIDRINQLIQKSHALAQKYQKTFGVSTSGNLKVNKEVLYADVEAWCKNSWIDFLQPQIYWGLEHSTMPFETVFKQFESIKHDVDLQVALAAYKVNTSDPWAKSGKDEWINNQDVLAKQTRIVFDHGCNSVSLFREAFLEKQELEQERQNFLNVIEEERKK